jgi:hypothetical protein
MYRRASNNYICRLLYRESNLCKDRPTRNLFGHAGSLLAVKRSLIRTSLLFCIMFLISSNLLYWSPVSKMCWKNPDLFLLCLISLICSFSFEWHSVRFHQWIVCYNLDTLTDEHRLLLIYQGTLVTMRRHLYCNTCSFRSWLRAADLQIRHA